MTPYYFYLGGTLIDEPVGWDASVLKRTRSQRFKGFVFKSLAYMETGKELTITDPIGREILHSDFERYGLNAETTFVIYEGDKLRFEGVVDYPTAKYGRDGWQIRIRDKNAVSELMSNIDTKYRVDFNAKVRFLGFNYLEGVTHKVTKETVVSNGGTAVSMAHSPPVQAQSNNTIQGTAQSVTNPLNNEPIWQNTTGKALTVTVSAQLNFTCRASASGNFTIQLLNNTTPTTVATIAINNTATARSVLFSQQITVAAGSSVFIRVGATQPTVNNWDFTYDENVTFVSVERSEPAVETEANAIKVYDALVALVNKASNGLLRLTSPLSTANYYLTNGKALRDKTCAFMNVSIGEIFDTLHRIENYQLDIEGDVVSIEQHSAKLKAMQVYDLGDVDEVLFEITDDNAYSSLKVGNKEWKASTPFSEDEPNGQRVYDLPLKVTKKELDLQTELITAGYVIEECRLAQFSGEKNNNFRFDAKNFLVACRVDSDDTIRAEKGSDFTTQTDTMDSEDMYNLRFMPDVSLLYHQNFLGDGTATLNSYTGNLAGVEIETLSLRSVFTGVKLNATVTMELEEYQALGTGLVSLTWEGNTYVGLLDEVTLMPETKGLSKAEITAHIIRPDVLNQLETQINWLQ